MGKLKASVHNLGCKVNAYESEAVMQLLEEAGYEIVPFSEPADVIVINTCTVTAVADKKTRQMLHRARHKNPDAVIAAMGCYVEIHADDMERNEDADIIIGNNRKGELVSLLDGYFKEGKRSVFLSEDRSLKEYEQLSVSGTMAHTRAFMKVQDGCNRFCTYCIIPYARGRIRSRKPEDVREETVRLAGSGIREIVLTGIHLSSYGREKDAGFSLADLVETVAEVPGISRIRLGSLEPGIIDEEFVKRISALPQVCPHFHLSLQSGCDKTLKNMNRAYTAAEYLEKCGMLRAYFDRPALTTDVIAGFPQETEEDFEESYAFVKKAGFFETHIFPYSKREGTLAAKMPGQCTEKVKKERVKRLLALDELQSQAFLMQSLGKPAEVLVEECLEKDGKTVCTGHTMRYENVFFTGSAEMKNTLVTVEPFRADVRTLFA